MGFGPLYLKKNIDSSGVDPLYFKKIAIRVGPCPLVYTKTVHLSGSLPTRFTLNHKFEWVKLPTSKIEKANLSHLLTSYVILRREYTLSFGLKYLIRVGWGPLVFVKVCVLSGPAPTRFNKSLRFEWVHTHSFFVNYTVRVGQGPLVPI